MKKFIIMLVMIVAVVSVKAQTIVKVTGDRVTLANGQVYMKRDLPAGPWLGVGEDMTLENNKHMQVLARENPAEWRRFQAIRPQPVAYDETVVGGGYGGYYGGGYGYYGANGANGGYVYGIGGGAGATSSVHIDNQNMVSTIGSGVYMHYDTGSNSLNISGDPLMAVGRVLSAIGGKKKSTQQPVQQPQQRQQVVYYVVDQNGNIIGQTTQPMQQPMQQVQQQPQQVQQSQSVQQRQPVQQSQSVQQRQPVQQSQQQPVQTQQNVQNAYSGF